MYFKCAEHYAHNREIWFHKAFTINWLFKSDDIKSQSVVLQHSIRPYHFANHTLRLIINYKSHYMSSPTQLPDNGRFIVSTYHLFIPFNLVGQSDCDSTWGSIRMGTPSPSQSTLCSEIGKEWRQGYRSAIQSSGLSDEGECYTWSVYCFLLYISSEFIETSPPTISDICLFDKTPTRAICRTCLLFDEICVFCVWYFEKTISLFCHPCVFEKCAALAECSCFDNGDKILVRRPYESSRGNPMEQEI